MANKVEVSDIQFPDIIVDVTPTLDTSAYADEDILFQATEVSNATRADGVSRCVSIVVNDDDDNGGAFDLYFFDQEVSLASANSAENMSDTVRDSILAVVSFTAGDYIDLANGQIAQKGPSDSGMMHLLQSSSPETSNSIWVGAVSQDTQTYTASGLKFKFGFIRS